MEPARIAALLDEGERAEARTMLDAALIDAHRSGNAHLLCSLHRLAARFWKADEDAEAFHLTHAYVFALEAGDTAQVAALHAALAERGRI